jgi:thymidine kinase
MASDVDIVGIDEAQFFDDEIIHVCEGWQCGEYV